jgi:hypothetical protein
MRENEHRTPTGERNIVQSGHDLVPILDSNVNPKWPPVISQFRSKLGFLTVNNRIREDIKIFDEEWAYTRPLHAPSQ